MQLKTDIFALPKIQHFNREAGFSLPEILIVLLTIAILTTLALPSGLRALQLYRLETSVSVISDKLMETRMSAIKRNRTSSLKIDKTARTAQIHSTNQKGETIDVNFPVAFPQGLQFDAVDSVEISFDSMGRISTGIQTLTFKETNSNKRKNIIVSPAGKISVGQMY